MNQLATNSFRFGDFELDTAKRLLLRGGNPVALNSKTFDLLETLLANRGEVLSREHLIESIWPDQFVEESNLTVQISTLRKALGEMLGENKFIVTVPGKGYKFVGEIDDETDQITIEKHRFARITVTEEIDEKPSPVLIGKTTRQKFIFSLIAACAVLVLLVGGFFTLRRTQNTYTSPFAQIRVRQLTNNGKVQIAALSPDGKQFTFVTDDLGQESLWLGRVDGGNDVLLRPPTESRYGDLAFSPDNAKIYYSIYDDANPEWSLYQIPAFGGVAEKIRDNIGNFALAPGGDQIVYFRRDKSEKNSELVIAQLSGGTERIITTLPGTVILNYGALSFSPDGKLIAFGSAHSETDSGQEVYVAQVVTGEVRCLTSQNFADVNSTAWLADGTGVVITALETASRSAVPQYRVWYVAVSNGEVRKLTSDLSSYNDALSVAGGAVLTIEHRQLNNVWIAPADNLNLAKQITSGSFGRYDGNWGLDWLPDGRIVFDSSDMTSQAISIMDADGGNRRQLTAPGNVDSALNASPDGRYIVFHSTRSGGLDIWRIDADGSNPKQLTFSKRSYQPFVSTDSRYVYYKSWGDGVGEMRRVAIDGGESVALTDNETSWSAASPDGRYIAASYRTDKSRLAIFSLDGGMPVKQFEIPKTGTLLGGSRWTPDSSTVVYGDSAYGYWQQSINGGEPKRLENLPKEKLYNFSWSRDGRQFAFVRGIELRDVVVITDSK